MVPISSDKRCEQHTPQPRQMLLETLQLALDLADGLGAATVAVRIASAIDDLERAEAAVQNERPNTNR